MTDKLLLHNTLSYYGLDAESDNSHIICSDDCIFTRITNQHSFSSDKTAHKIRTAFEKGSRFVMLSGKEGSGKSTSLRFFAHTAKDLFGCVIFTEFDGDRYVFYESGFNSLDDSYIAEKCITNIFYPKEFAGKNSKSPYLYKSTKERLLKLADRNTLIIIDNLNTVTIPVFLYELEKYGFGILICCRETVQAPKGAVVIKQEKQNFSALKTIIGTKKISTSFKDFCSMTGHSPMAVQLAKCFIESKAFTLSDIVQSFQKLCRDKGLDSSVDYIKLFYFLADFSNGEKELLRTLAVLLHFKHPMLKTSIDKNGAFKRIHACCFTSKSPEKLSRLIDYGFIGELVDGTLYMENAIKDFVLNFLKPTQANCPCFMNYISRKTDFLLSQSAKNLSFSFVTEPCSHIKNPLFHPELYDAYAYLIKDKPDCSRVIYNLVMMLTSRQDDSGCFIFLRSGAFYASILKNVMFGDYARSLYQSADDLFLYSKAHTAEIFGLLDILRVCTVLIKNISVQHYNQYLPIFHLFKDTLNQITRYTHGKFSDEDVLSVYCDVIRLCEESFFYFNNFSYSTGMHPARCKMDAVIGYTDETSSNVKNSCSIYVLHSIDVFMLYVEFYQLARCFNALSEKASCPAKYSYSRELTSRAKDFCREFSSFYCRLRQGFDVFYDFYGDKYVCIDVKKSVAATGCDKIRTMLEKAQELSSLYCDDSQSKCSVYAKNVMSTLKRSEHYLYLSSLIIHPDFPVSPQCLDYFQQMGFSDFIKKKGNDDTRIIAEAVASHLADKSEKSSFYLSLLGDLLKAYGKDLCNDVVFGGISAALIAKVCSILEEAIAFNRGISFAVRQLSSICEDGIFTLFSYHKEYIPKLMTSEMCIAFSLYRLITGKKIIYPPEELKEAFLSFVYEHISLGGNISPVGFSCCVRLLCTKHRAVEIINEMLSLDFFNSITKSDYHIIRSIITNPKNVKIKKNKC